MKPDCNADSATMPRRIDIKPLAGPLVRMAYPFASTLGLDDPESWRDFVASFTAGAKAGSGAIAAQDASGYVRGVLFHQTNRHRARAPALVCDPMLVAELPGSENLVRALLAAADRIAVEQGCKWVRVVLPASGDPLDEAGRGCGQAVLRAGFALEGVSFRRRRALPMRADVEPAQDARRANR
jgi:hypothetical protein